MQVGHVGIALAIASYDWSPETALVVAGSQFLPNADVLFFRDAETRDKYHGTLTHSLLFALPISAIVWLISPHYGPFVLISMLAHYAADIGVDVGVPLFFPISRKRFSLNLFKTSGTWGKSMWIGYYRQPWPLVLETAVFAFLAFRMWTLYA